MQEKLIRNVALICVAVGLIMLYWHTLANPIDISKITLDSVGTSVIVRGYVEWKRVSNNHVFLGLADITGEIGAVIFNTTALKLNKSGVDVYSFSPGDEILFTGIVEEYPEGSNKLNLIHRMGSIGRV